MNCSSTATTAALRRAAHRDRVKVVVGGQRGVDVAAPQGAREALVGRAHRGEVGRGQASAGGLATASSCIAATTAWASRAARASSVLTWWSGRGRDHQARLRQPQQRLAHRRAADAEPLREVAVAELLARREGAVDDRVAQPHVHVVAQERPGRRRLPRDRHAIYCTPRAPPVKAEL